MAYRMAPLPMPLNDPDGMPYSSMLFYANLNSLASRRVDLSRVFFCDIMDPASCLHTLLFPSRSTQLP